jgi:Spy/CpxP family protein refolding chaperone
MKNLVIASVVASVLGLGVAALWADTPAPTTKPHESFLVRHFEKIGLNLSAEQITKIDDIEKAGHAATKAVLTADQQKLLADAKGSKGKEAMRAAFQEVRKTMTADQKTKLRDIRKAGFEQVKAVLTADQLAKFNESHKGHAGHKGASHPAPVTPAPAPAPTT